MTSATAPATEEAPRIGVAVLGATGVVGQKFVELLAASHPYFAIVAVTTGRKESVGQPYASVTTWRLGGGSPIPPTVAALPMLPTDPEACWRAGARLAFSALPTGVARVAEPLFAAAGFAVCSNSSPYRMGEHVPLLIPEVNADHVVPMVAAQKRVAAAAAAAPSHGSSSGRRHALSPTAAAAAQREGGFIVCNPNCTSTGLCMALAALKPFGLRRMVLTSMQALSGAGYPGVASLDVVANVLPNVANGSEAKKLESEPRKILGTVTEEGRSAESAEFIISAHTNRVPVIDGHTVCVSVELQNPPATAEDVAQAMATFAPPGVVTRLPSSPAACIQVRREPQRPQPRLDIHAGGGMTAVVGQIARDNVFSYKFTVVSHNTVRGAAGGAILNAELLHALKLLPPPPPPPPSTTTAVVGSTTRRDKGDDRRPSPSASEGPPPPSMRSHL